MCINSYLLHYRLKIRRCGGWTKQNSLFSACTTQLPHSHHNKYYIIAEEKKNNNNTVISIVIVTIIIELCCYYCCSDDDVVCNVYDKQIHDSQTT